MKPELKPCPFCGGEIRLFDTGYFWWTCKGCGVCSKGYYSKEKAIEAWNRRKDESKC